jgi:hypothetical protein
MGAVEERRALEGVSNAWRKLVAGAKGPPAPPPPPAALPPAQTPPQAPPAPQRTP